MLRDKICDKNFEHSLMYEINRVKIAARKMHNDHKTGFEDPRAEILLHDAILELVAIAYHDLASTARALPGAGSLYNH